MEEFSWCLHCERVSLAKDAEKAQGCPICGAIMWDIRPWQDLREDIPSYPQVPTQGSTTRSIRSRAKEAHMARIRTLRLAKHIREFIDFLYEYPNGKKIAEDYLQEQGLIREGERLYEAVSVMSEGNSMYQGAPTRYTVMGAGVAGLASGT